MTDDTSLGPGQDVSYDVYILHEVGELGFETWSDRIKSFAEERNALAYKARLEAVGKTVRIERVVIDGLSELAKERWFSDYEAKWRSSTKV